MLQATLFLQGFWVCGKAFYDRLCLATLVVNRHAPFREIYTNAAKARRDVAVQVSKAGGLKRDDEVIEEGMRLLLWASLAAAHGRPGPPQDFLKAKANTTSA